MREGSVRALLDPAEEREWLADIAAVEGFLRPHTVAVVGASRRRGTIGGELFHNLLSFGFTGSVLPINPSTSSVQGVLAYPSIDAAPGPIDLAVIVVPAEAVLGVVEQCERKGIKHLVIISAGFGEAGPEGVRRQEALMNRCRAAGIRVIGPNCMGIVNTEADVRLSATFAPTPPEPGRLAFMSQSGALGLAIMDYASRIGLGLSSFVSVGNKADISGNDLIRYWARDERVDVILLYLESFGNPRKFSRIARRVARAKPIVAVKSGRSPAGARAAGSHTGALIAASDTTVDALFRHAGVVRTDTLEEMFDVASLLAHQPVPKGRRVAIVTNAGGPGILCADACAAEGLEIAPLADDTRRALRALLPPAASVENPVDMIASAPADHFRETLRIVGKDGAVDAIIAIYVPPLVTGAEEVARAILDGGRSLDREKPLLTVFMQARGLPEGLSAPDIRIPSYAFPESAAIALARAARYGEWLSRPDVEPVRPDGLRRAEAESVIARALARGDAWLDPEDVWRVLTAYGFPLVEQRVCVTAEEVSGAARKLGGVLALKAQSAGVLHKTEAGAVELRVPAAEAGSVARRMEARLRAAGRTPVSFTLQRMANPGLEMIVGAVHDPQFGPVLACGAGGTLVELLKDVSLRIAPVAEPEAREMLGELKTYPALTGYRGAPPRDVASLVDVIVRAGWLVDELPQIQELDLNPVVVHEEGATVVDARIRIGKNGA
jgi:acetyl coenzyme A synthetase (ADP forming)-like protein